MLNSLDLFVIVLYLVVITWIGSRFYHRDVGLREYLLGNKAMRWFPVALSILAADVSAITYLGSPGWAYQYDLKLMAGVLPYFIAIPIVIRYFLPVYAKGTLYTAYQYVEHRFDLRLRLLTCLFFLIVRGAHVAVIIYTPALVMYELIGLPLWFSILAMGILTAVYTTLGGIKAVIWTDTLQVVIVLIGLTVVTISAISNIPGGLSEVWAIGLQHNKLDLADFSLNLDKTDNFWAVIIGGTLLSIQSLGTDQSVLQKFFTTKSTRETAKSLIFFGIVIVPLLVALYVLGIILYAFYIHHPELQATVKKPDAIVAHYAANMLPHGLAGILVASVFAGAMSTVSASINSLATSSIVDVYQRIFRRDETEEHYTRASRWATILWGALATAAAFYVAGLGELILAYTKIQSVMGGVILAIFLLGVMSKRVRANEVFVGSIVGLIAIIYVAKYTSLSLFWHCPLGCAITIIASWFCWGLFGMLGIDRPSQRDS